MKYFVTGATGFIGSVVVQQLLQAEQQVLAIVRSPSKARGLEEKGVQLFEGDVTEKESMRAAMQGVDGVFHIAGWYKIGARDKRGGQRINVQGTRNVLELMKELGIPRGVYTSTLAVNSDTRGQIVDEAYHFTGKHLSEYDRSKAAAHEVAREMIAEGLPLIIVSPGLVYGPGDTSSVRASMIQYLERKLPLLPRRTTLCWAHVEDTARGHLLAMEKGRLGETYFIPGEPYSLYGAYRLAQEITGIPAPLGVPPQLIKIMSALVKPFDRFMPESYTSEGLRIIAGVTYIGSNDKARNELGFDPRPLRVGWEQTLNHELALLGKKARRK
ncbi:MAG: NAD-dependent epimerase/dehydratase family protein [Chloroflexota bacterium]